MSGKDKVVKSWFAGVKTEVVGRGEKTRGIGASEWWDS